MPTMPLDQPTKLSQESRRRSMKESANIAFTDREHEYMNMCLPNHRSSATPKIFQKYELTIYARQTVFEPVM